MSYPRNAIQQDYGALVEMIQESSNRMVQVLALLEQHYCPGTENHSYTRAHDIEPG